MKSKTFDCVEWQDRVALRIYEETKNMSVQEQLAYWREREQQLLKRRLELQSAREQPRQD